MKGCLIGPGVVSLLLVSGLAYSENLVYGLERAQHFTSKTGGNFTIQAASFTKRANADIYQHALQRLTKHPVAVITGKNKYAVVVGPLASAAELRKTARQLLNNSVKNKPETIAQSKTMRPKVTSSSSNNSPPLSTGDNIVLPYASHANWYGTIGSGAGLPLSMGNLYVDNGSLFPSPYDKDIYSTNQSSGTLISLTAGRRWERGSVWFPAYSLGILYQHQFFDTLKGTVTQYSLPEFTNYNYRLNQSADLVQGIVKLNLYDLKGLSPYVSAGLGNSFNRADYHETALADVTARVSPGFAANRSQFAYNAGAGLDYRASQHFIVNVGYVYQHFGDMSAQGIQTWADTSLALKSYGLNEVVGGLTYLFDQ